MSLLPDQSAEAKPATPLEPDWSQVQWTQPWFNCIEHAADQIQQIDELSVCARLNRLLMRDPSPERARTGRGKTLSFFPSDRVPTQDANYAYERYIADTGKVPTRNNWHDAFNGLMWLSMPQTKAQLNAIQADAIEQAQYQATLGGQDLTHPARGSLRDAATLIDENAIILACADEACWQRLVRFDWQALFVKHRTDFLLGTEAWVFGHALLEKLLNPYKSITAHVFAVPVERTYFHWAMAERRAFVDQAAAAWLDSRAASASLNPGALTPLPVLGIPGWWPENTRPEFYADTAVFRPGRVRQRI